MILSEYVKQLENGLKKLTEEEALVYSEINKLQSILEKNRHSQSELKGAITAVNEIIKQQEDRKEDKLDV